MQISLGVSADKVSCLQQPAGGYEGDAHSLPTKPYIYHLPKPMDLVTTAAGTNLASFNF